MKTIPRTRFFENAKIHRLVLFLFLSSAALLASPNPPLAWEKADINFKLRNGEQLKLSMACPEGKLKEFVVKKGKKRSKDIVPKLKASKYVCSGLKTSYIYDDDAMKILSGISFTIEYSQEYIKRELFLSFDLKKFKFDLAQWQVTEPGKNSHIDQIDLN